MKRHSIFLLLVLLLASCRDKVVKFNEYGNVEYFVNQDNQIDGLLTQYHPNGNLYWKVSFNDGKKEGKVNYYDSLGNLFQTVNYKQGELDGICRTFYLNGSTEWETKFILGLKDGKHTKLFPNGQIKIEKLYIRDSLVSENEYDTLGNLLSRYIDVKSEISRTTDSTIFLYKLVNPMFNRIAIQILAEDSIKEIDTLFQYRIDTNQYKVSFKNSKVHGKTVFTGFFELDSTNVVKGLQKFTYEFE